MKRIDPKEQFSKKLATWTAGFWFVFMCMAAGMCVAVPAVADAAVYLAICASVIMLVNVWAYTRNSVYEKAILAGLEKIRIGRLSWKGTGSGSTMDDDPDEDSDPDEEEGGNG